MDALVTASRESIARGSKSFATASRLFGRGPRESAWQLYAWCRYCDDVIDGQEGGHGRQWVSCQDRQRQLAMLYAETRGALAGGRVEHPAFAGLQRVVQRHEIPHRFPIELLDGFAMDVEGRRYESLDDTLEYCYYVAGVVGVMMAIVMGVGDEGVLDRACDLGIAFQLTNIARDLVEDAAAGRVYLPQAWLDATGVPAANVGLPAHRSTLARLAEQLVTTAEPYYASARRGLVALPWRSAWAVAAALGVYRDIGRVVVERGARAWDHRVVVSRGRKASRIVEALGLVLWGRATSPRRTPRNRQGLWSRTRVTVS
jgi:15-cis-phytoene synthase